MSVFSLPPSSGLVNVTHINGETNLTPADCGTVILGNTTEQAAGTGFKVNLPTPQRGLFFNFILRPPSIAANATAAITVQATTNGTTASEGNIVVGQVVGLTTAGNGGSVTPGDIITFVHDKATRGDYAECVCDGTNWFVRSVSDADGAVTVS